MLFASPIFRISSLFSAAPMIAPLINLNWFAFKHSRLFQTANAIFGITEIPLQNLAIMLAQIRRLQVEFRGKAGKAQRKTWYVDLADSPIHYPAHPAALAQMRMLHRLLNRQYWRHRDMVRLKNPQRFFFARLRVEPVLNRGDNQV